MNLESARSNMLSQQFRTWEVIDERVLDALATTPREDFVPPAYRHLAFADTELPLGQGQSMLAPKIEARMLQALAVASGERVLEIGTGSGYLTAVLGALASHVDSVEIDPTLLAQARARLDARGVRNVTLHEGDGARGWPAAAPYDVIAVTGSVATLEEDFQQQLNPGGRLFVVVGRPPIMEARLITRVGAESFSTRSLFETSLPPLVGCEPRPRFVL